MTINRDALIIQIQQMQSQRRQLREQERSLAGKEKYLTQMPTIAKDNLGLNLSRVLPSHLVPTNVGGYAHVLTPYWHEVNFELGTDPTITPNFRSERNFQVTQEAAFLLTTISRAYKSGGSAGFGAPFMLDIRDNQSTRQFNDLSIPIQHIGNKSEPTELAVPLLLMPNASVRITLSTWLTANQDLVGNAYQEFAFGGYRVSVEDANYILNQVLV